MPVWVAVGAAALDAAVHAWDIAVAVGAPTPISDDDARFLLSVAAEIVEPLRQYGVYAAAIGPQEGALPMLLGYLGRRADWTPTA